VKIYLYILILAPVFILLGLGLLLLRDMNTKLSERKSRSNLYNREIFSSYPDFKVNLDGFKDGEDIPPKFTCDGFNINPKIKITGVPDDTKELAVVMISQNNNGKDFIHWLMWNISATVTEITEDSVPTGALIGKNGNGNLKYEGPCLEAENQLLVFKVYALKEGFKLRQNSDHNAFLKAIKDKVVAETVYTVVYNN
jgi:Raf kinase inhibitor-like YbhB/YbcL family protein